ncbi:hypothetical protein [Mangrovicella endophytica]|uniref:hypothetical protein n=1 Tax=Mangrovicella endophytica TaxID=2066697 RepID=UPI000C9EA2DA|nr:hypothetical protein [Mangrovicella endophytica]
MRFDTIAFSVGIAGTLLVSNLQGATILPANDGLAATVLVDPVITNSVQPATTPAEANAIRMIDLRSGTTCKAAKPDASAKTFRYAPIGADCAGSPELSKIAYWRASDDGTLIMADSSGDTVLRFAPGDGVLYESVYPPTALITIVPAKS